MSRRHGIGVPIRSGNRVATCLSERCAAGILELTLAGSALGCCLRPCCGPDLLLGQARWPASYRPELGEDVGDMVVYGLRTEAKGWGDLPLAKPLAMNTERVCPRRMAKAATSA